jgi:hypothetical protein
MPNSTHVINARGKEQMKVLQALSIVTAAAIFSMTPALAGPVAKQVQELEAHIKWSAVGSNWKSLRPGWEAATSKCSDAQCAAKQLLSLEENVNWEAVGGDWKTLRDPWVSKCKAAKTEGSVGKLLLEFEENLGWPSVDEGWKTRRDGWVAEVSVDK